MSPRKFTGLTAEEAARRLAAEGANELPARGRRNTWRIALGVLSEPMFALLVVAAGIYLALGDLAEAAILGAFATLSVSLAVVQEVRSERVLDALREMTSPRALVIRDGRRRRIAGRDVVHGDLIVLAEGDRVPADAWVLVGDDLSVDESLLTGESVPVRKRPKPDEEPHALTPGGDDLPTVFSGTLVVRGQVEAVVTATGPASAIGKIGKALAGIRPEVPRLRQETQRIVRIFATAGVAVAIVSGTLYGIAQESWLEGALSGIAVGMSLLPEEFPLVLTVFMVMGAWRIAQARVLTRRAASIQTLGAVTVLCTDKTGTLTLNRMAIAHLEAGDALWKPDRGGEPSGRIGELMHVATLAGLPEPFDPMERAMHALLERLGHEPGRVFEARELAHRQGVTPELLAMTQVWRESGDAAIAATKGAPEAILALCGATEDERCRVLRRTSELATQGMRVLAVAKAEAGGEADFARVLRGRFEFLGLIGYEDPLRDTVPAAVRECRTAGVRVVMITGDYPETARAIASKAGLRTTTVLSGADLKALDDIVLRERVRDCDVFARILPEQKLRIVEALKANGEIVGMTGDGVNDAPSLRAAHIGIAMGGRGTDVAREASSIVLLDDDFGSIVKTIRLGRRIYDNLQKAMSYIMAVHVPIAGMALLPLAFGAPPILTPAIVALLEMIIDPSCSIIFEAEPEEEKIMSRPPRDPNERLLNWRILLSSLGHGVAAFMAVASIYVAALSWGRETDDLRALMLVSLALANAALVFTHRGLRSTLAETLGRSNPWFWYGIGGVAAVLALVLSLPFLRDVLRLGLPQLGDLGLAFLTVSLLFALLMLEPRGNAGAVNKPR